MESGAASGGSLATAIAILEKRYEKRLFKTGFMGYADLVRANGHPQGLTADLCSDFAKLFGADLENPRQGAKIWEKCTWHNFTDKISHKRVETFAEPVIWTQSRPIHIIPYCKIQVGMLVYDPAHDRAVQSVTGELAQLRRQLLQARKAGAGREVDVKRIEITDKLRELDSIGTGLHVISGMLDRDVLGSLSVNVKEVPIQNGEFAVTAERLLETHGLLIVDKLMLRTLEDAKVHLESKCLFGDPPLTVPAGFAVRPDDDALATFLTHECREEETTTRKGLERLGGFSLERNGLELLSPSRIDRFNGEPYRRDSLTYWLDPEPGRPAESEPFQASVSVAQFLVHAKALEARGYLRSAIDLIHDSIDELFRRGQFALCDALLAEVEVGSCSADALISLLTATAPAKQQLAARGDFFGRVRTMLEKRGEMEVGLLEGLE